MLRTGPAFFVILMFSAEAGNACPPPPPPMQLPEETDQAYSTRARAMVEVLDFERRRGFQQRLYDEAQRVSLAIVEKSTAVDAAGLPGNSIIVRPITSLKGEFDPRLVTLTDRVMTSCGPAGGGPATTSSPREYIVLLEGELLGTPPSAYGIHISEIREPRILEGVNQFAERLSAPEKQD